MFDVQITWPDKTRVIEGQLEARDQLHLVEAPEGTWAFLSAPGLHIHYKRTKGIWKLVHEAYHSQDVAR